MPISILHRETSITVLARFKLIRNLHTLARHVSAELFGVVRLERDVRQTILLRILQLRKDLDVLVVVHLEEGEQQPAAITFVERERFLVTQQSTIELPRCDEIVSSQTDVSHAQNLGTDRCRILCSRREGQTQQYEQEKTKAHSSPFK